MAERIMLCEECGLPLTICNALAAYRSAVKYYIAGNKEAAISFVADAKDYYEQYRAEREPPPVQVMSIKEQKDRKDTAKFWCTVHGPSDVPCPICFAKGPK